MKAGIFLPFFYENILEEINITLHFFYKYKHVKQKPSGWQCSRSCNMPTLLVAYRTLCCFPVAANSTRVQRHCRRH